jgi:integrase
VWKLKGGGYVASAQMRDPKRQPVPGMRPRYKTIFGVLRNAQSAKEALDWLEAERRRVTAKASPTEPMKRWNEYAASVFEKKVAARDIESEAGVGKYRDCLAGIIRTAAWAALPVDQVRNGQIQDWRDELPTLTWEVKRQLKSGEIKIISSGTYGPRTLNTWLAIARVIWKSATIRFDLSRNPMDGIKDFSTKTAKTFTKEEPNSLNPRTEVAEFLALLRSLHPQHYAFALTGFVLGQRPSTLRPLRRRGPHADIDLVAKRLYFRRSYTVGPTVMETTKTGAEPEVALPDELVEVLRAHIAEMDAHPVASKSDLIFPSLRTGKMLSSTVLRKPFAAVMEKMGLKRKLTAKAMRRTYQDLADEVQMRAAAAMSVSGHKTMAMKLHYSTAHDDEVRAGVGKVIQLATARKKAAGEEKS